jgi:hypothetical protein
MSKPVAAAEKKENRGSRLRNLAAVLQKINKTKTVINILKRRTVLKNAAGNIVPCIAKAIKYMTKRVIVPFAECI